jgi:hypothetical protein
LVALRMQRSAGRRMRARRKKITEKQSPEPVLDARF